MTSARAHGDDAQRFLSLLAQPGDVFELRALTKGRATPQVTAGYFDDMGALAAAAVDRSGRDDGVYITLNPVNPALLARAPKNRVRQAGNGDTTSDRDVRARKHMLIDVDPVRPTGISSTNAEHTAAIELSNRIADELVVLGWPEPIRADSGNGGHLIYAIDLPVADGDLVKRVLSELSRRFTTADLKVDEKVFNAARISKIYGTLTRKGEDTDDRPHRFARLLRTPDRLDVVPRELLEAFVPAVHQPSPKPARNGERPLPTFDLDGWIAEHLPDAVAQPWSEGRKWLLPICPFNDSHNRREAYITEKHGGMIAAGCQHESCFKSWRELRQHFEPTAYTKTNGQNGHSQNGHRVSDRTPPPEVVYQDDAYNAEVDAFADRDRETPQEHAVAFQLLTIADAYDELQRLAGMPIYKTPFETLNEAIGFEGLLGTQVYTVAAGTGRGKTSWVAAVAAYVAETVPVLIASYEMKPGYFVARKAAGVLRVHSNEIIRGKHDRERVLGAVNYPRLRLMHKPSLKQLRAAVEHMTKLHGIPPLVIVDYLQKLADEIASKQARPDLRLATSAASSELLDIGETTGAAIIAVSAIGRGKGKALANPRKHEPYELVEVAKESGAVEYDGAGLIVLSLSSDYDGDWRIGTMTVAKARFGTEMHIESRYHGPRGDWRDEGPVASVPRIQTPPDNGELRAAITNALSANGPCTRRRLASLTSRGWPTIDSEVSVMLSQHAAITIGNKIGLPIHAETKSTQIALAAVPGGEP